MGVIFISTQILDFLRKLQSFRKWDQGIHINLDDKISYTTQYKEAILKYVENLFCGKHRHWPVNEPENIENSNLIPPAMTSWSGQSSVDP